MRILLVSDLHYTLPQLDWVVRAAPGFDLVVLAGDSLDISSIVPLEAQSVVILRDLSLLKAATSVVIASGNHDLTGPDARGEQCALWLGAARAAGVPTDGDSWSAGDTLVTVCPWWDGPLTAQVVDRQLAEDAELVVWIEQHQPAIVMCGHVHPSPFMPDGSWIDRIGSTMVLNAGKQPGPVPTHIEIDTDARVARWLSYEGVDEQTFAGAASA